MSEGFAKIRNGLKDHIDQGKMSATDIGVYTFLHLYCTWKTGIWFGNALNIAAKTLSSRRSISDSLHRLRQRGYINYATTRGKRGSYCVLIHKFEPQYGPWEGYRLIAWKYTDKVEANYEKIPDHERWKEQLESGAVRSEGADGAMMPPRDRVETAMTVPPRCNDGASLPEQQMLQTGQTVPEGADNTQPTPTDVSCCSPSASQKTENRGGDPHTPQSGLIAGYTRETILAHYDKLLSSGQPWVCGAGRDGIKRMRPKYVQHLMSLEPLKSGGTCKCGSPKPCDKHDLKIVHVPNAVPPVDLDEMPLPEPCWNCNNSLENKGKKCAFHKDFLPRIKACPNCKQLPKGVTEMCQAHISDNKQYMLTKDFE
jgi:hypothetical protein